MTEDPDRYQSLMEQSVDGIFLTDEQGRYVDVNAAGCRMLGYTREQILKLSIPDLVSPEERQRVPLRLSELRADKTLLVERIMRRADGTDLPTEISARRLPDGRFQAIVRDIRDRKLAAQEIREHNRLLTAVNDALSAYLTEADFTKALGRLLAFARERTQSECGFVGVMIEGPVLRILALDGIDVERLVQAIGCAPLPDRGAEGVLDFDHFNDLIGRVVTRGQGVVHNPPGGEPASGVLSTSETGPWRSFLGVPVMRGTEPAGLIALANRAGGYSAADREMLETLVRQTGLLADCYRRQWHESRLALQRQAAEQALLREKRFTDGVVNSLPGVFYVFDETGKFSLWNRNLEQVTGYTGAELSERHPLELIAIPDRPLVEAKIRECFQHGQAIAEAMLLTRDGATIPYHFTGSRFTREGKNYLLGMGIDLTVQRTTEAARARLEQQLRESQKIESIGRLAGGVAHDFNNLLTSILGHVEMAGERLSSEGLVGEHLDAIRLAAERSAALTSQLLAFARRQMLAPRPVNLNEAIQEAAKLLARRLGERIQLQLKESPEPIFALVDPGQLSRVLINLTVNARDAMPDGGRVMLRADVEVIGETGHPAIPDAKPGTYALLLVSDTGPGLSREAREHLFEPFFTTKGAGHGTGLGLATCYGIIRQHHGHIFAESRVGHGTTFHILLPLAPAGVAAVPIAAAATKERHLETILFCEDDDLVRDMTSRVLRARGYTVLAARDGAQALAMAAEHAATIHLLITEESIPGTGGLDLARQLRAVRSRLTVLVLTGTGGECALPEPASGARMAWLSKPFTPTELVQKVQDVLVGGQF